MSTALKVDYLEPRLEVAWNLLWSDLQAARVGSHWCGQLSTSALSTATAVSAMFQTQLANAVPSGQVREVEAAIETGVSWLAGAQNPDGGFGDTDRSHSNVATTLLVLAAWKMTAYDRQFEPQTQAAWDYVDRLGRWDALRQRYGKDKTFVVPILSNCALAGLVDWSEVPALPFEAAWLPQQWYRWAQMPVVSYAIPALVAIGQARFHFAPPGNPLVRAFRKRAVQPTLKVLASMQPDSGGYLEATPLTSFVLMSLSAVGHGNLGVAQSCLRFILDSRLKDGSWPIDTNLATWLTSLSIGAASRRGPNQQVTVTRLSKPAGSLQPAGETCGDSASSTVAKAQEPTVVDDQGPGASSAAGTASEIPSLPVSTLRWLLGCQHAKRHPFTGAEPGGWGWTDLSGAVPDADDTPAALLALGRVDWDAGEVRDLQPTALNAVAGGLQWLVDLQNRDGGWPTFCRGWGKLPFDRSGTDLTAHAIRAISLWLPKLKDIQAGCAIVAGQRVEGGVVFSVPPKWQLQRAIERGFRFLAGRQQSDGSWLPLWFGNQDRSEEDNPVYGTARVLLAYAEQAKLADEAAVAGMQYLTNTQNADGGWGGGRSLRYPDWHPGSSEGPGMVSSIEETAVALEALIQCGGNPKQDATIMRGLTWLADAVQAGHHRYAWPIGFYFAKLWYYEELYPTIFSLAAFGSAIKRMNETC